MQQRVATPNTRAQLDALKQRRDELSRQINEISDRRTKLSNERFQNTVNQNPALVAEADAQIKELGARLKRLEAEKYAADDAIAAALPRVVSGTEVATQAAIDAATSDAAIEAVVRKATASIPPREPGFQPRTVMRMLGLEAVVFVLAGAVAWRWALRSALRRERVLTGQQDASLRQAVDAIAIEVERISENQRYVTKLLTDGQAGLGTEAKPEHAPASRDSG